MRDLIIVGAGPSGLTAALYALRSGNKVTLIEQGAPGGQLLKTEKIDNYPGFANGILGMELATNMFQQISSYSNLELETQTVISIKKETDKVVVATGNGNAIEGHSLVLAMGGNPRLLDIPGEVEYTGKGVSYCAICDGFFFKDKITTVIGGGDTAFEDALYLAKISKEVHLIHRRDTFRASKILTEQLKNHNNIQLHLNYTPKAILGDTKVEKIEIESTSGESNKTIETNGVFVAIGQKMNTDFLNNQIPLNKDGRIIVNHKMATEIQGIFACGDIIAKSLYQVSTAVGDGAVAGQEAVYYIENK
ncbi:hypothetical protein AZF37_07650 [endosymbiont 'TC1' of Trimyema compressum]|uniref:thioredoxin-disulfide reductase n=1 Tax=endosymbiont 'TC1' of Trimyema compressum TaxID=243899 RepID=UPI0007F11280|nr:thioredoxin-disulfide reductase [endosymbiont 'TC1' of Trimyema compressum]AMP21053.1 hypothetical protein AZF37_07650 [endosymbiont 'TC1' of Trimyema compressum]